jgi:Mg/Co/Ni transporter MgtE
MVAALPAALNGDERLPRVRPQDDLRRVASLFLEHGVDALLCVDGDDRVLGRLTRDAVAARLATVGGGEAAA